MKKMDAKQLESMSKRIRRHILKMTTEATSGHPGGSMSAADIITVLYFYQMNHDPKNPRWPDRDRFVLSKGHAAPALYAALAEAGYFPTKDLTGLRSIDSYLQGHPDMRNIPGIDVSTGSLGQGLSISVGMALAARLDKKGHRIYCMLGDGECQEGQVWEAAMAAAHYKLDNITAFLDRNTLQIDGCTEDIMALEPIAEKWRAFGWDVLKIDGNSIPDIITALRHKPDGKPIMIIAYTTKGKGVSFMENVCAFHGKPTTQQQMLDGLEELK